jgi:hypothetical protein
MSHPARLPRCLELLVALYFGASLLHFVHNAEYIAFYPNMPASITRETVYLVWLAITAVGVTGLALARVGWRAIAGLCLAVYGALGLDGLGHYALALCAEHTLAMNATIWFEVAAGITLAIAAIVWAVRSVHTPTAR